MKNTFSNREVGNSKVFINGEWYQVDYKIDKFYENKVTKSKVYVFPKNESIMENMLNRRNRPVDLYKRISFQVLEDLGISVEKLNWSQKAGCNCGCSPGFNFRPFGSEAYCYNVYVHFDKVGTENE